MVLLSGLLVGFRFRAVACISLQVLVDLVGVWCFTAGCVWLFVCGLSVLLPCCV